MNEKQQRLMQQITEKAFRDKMLSWQRSESLSTQHNRQYAQLKKYYHEYLVEQENKNSRVQNALLLNNAHCFFNHFQRMLILQRNVVQKCETIKEKCRCEWKKQQAKRKYLRCLKRLEWESEEEEVGQAKNMLRKD
jgi:flagellar biosynthesis chaperone FliJ